MAPIPSSFQAGVMMGIFGQEHGNQKFRCCIAIDSSNAIIIYQRKTPGSMELLDVLLEKTKSSDVLNLHELELKDPRSFISLKSLGTGDFVSYEINILRAEDRGNIRIHAFLSRLKANFEQMDNINLGEIIKFNGTEFLGVPFYYHHALLSDEKKLLIIHKTGEPNLKISKCEKSCVRETYLMAEATKREISKDTSSEHLTPFPVAVILANARKKMGETKYGLITDNCQHFCTKCRFGEARSSDVRKYGTWAVVTAGIATLGAAIAIFGKKEQDSEKKNDQCASNMA